MQTSRVALIAFATFSLGFWLGHQHPSGQAYGGETRGSETGGHKSAPTLIAQENLKQTNSAVTPAQSTLVIPTPGLTKTLNHIRQLQAEGKTNQALRQLKDFIQANYNSAEAWLLKAQLCQQLQSPQESVDAWFHYLRLELAAEKIAWALSNLQKYLLALSGEVQGPGAQSDWLIEQWNRLLEASANRSQNGQAHLALARLYQLAQDDYQSQYHALAAANDPSIKNETQAFLAQLNGASLQTGISLPLQRYGQQYLLEVQLNGQRARLLLDTGASISGLGRNFLNRHSELIKNTRPIELHTASGTEQTYVFSLDEIQLGDASFHQQLMVALPMATADFDGLLGIDLLGKFHFVIDQNKAELQLKPRD